jgi:hypothetical protein
MGTFQKFAAQGEIYIMKVEKVPEGCTPLTPENGKFIVGHSETGHHHVLDAKHTEVMVLDKPPEGMKILYAIVKEPTPLVHLRSYDTHKPIMFDTAIYELRIGREYDPFLELARSSQD